jgi:hypothetical protein
VGVGCDFAQEGGEESKLDAPRRFWRTVEMVVEKRLCERSS